jgi:NAD(P)-dependent dehydrogenase (short-subunit alcohol dehydrogenase family)
MFAHWHIVGAGAGIASAYCASKFAIRGLTHAAGTPFPTAGAFFSPWFYGFVDEWILEASDFGKYSITVNAYAPGVINTRMSRSSSPLHFTTRITVSIS